MEQRELVGFTRPNGGEAEFRVTGGSALAEGLGDSLPVPEEGFPMAGEEVEPEEDDDLGAGGDRYALLNPDSEKWAQGDGLEEQEFSIKEASFSQGSLKLKIQTTKRAKKPPKNLENYICPPEIRVTVKQPGEQKLAKQGKNTMGGKEDDSSVLKNKFYETPFKPVAEQNGSDHLEDLRGESMKPKQQLRSSLQHQLDRTHPDPPARGGSPQGNVADSESKRESASVNRSSPPDLTNPLSKLQQRKVTGSVPLGLFASGMASQIPGSQVKPSSAANMPPATQPSSSITMLTTSKKDKGLQEVTELVFGNIKRKYGRKDSIRNVVAYNSESQLGKRAEKSPETETQDKVKEKLIFEPEKTDKFPSGGSESAGKKVEKESEIHSVAPPAKTDEHKMHPWRKRKYGDSLKDLTALRDSTEELSELNKNVERGFSEPKPPNRFEQRMVKQVEDSQAEAATAVAMTAMSDICRNKLRKNPVRKASTPVDLSNQADEKLQKPKGKERWSHLKSKTPSHPNNCSSLSTAVLEPPSAYPITPSSPLYTNTDSLTAITPVKKKRGRPKKQPLLTVETIHEGTSSSPISPIARELPGTLKKRRKKHHFSDLLDVAKVKAPSSSNQLRHNKKTGLVGVRDKNSSKRIKMVKMKHILNEILSCSANSNLILKSTTPVSNAVSTVASKIEARLGKQINISKRGTIYIGKKRGRKPKAEVQAQQDQHKLHGKHSASSQLENPAVPSNQQTMSTISSARNMPLPSTQPAGAGGMLCLANTETSLQDLKTMPNLQPVSALPTRAPKGYHSSNWKLSPPRLMTNSPSHLSEVASIKEVTLSPISESHSEETIPSDSGIGTDNNSTSDQAEKGPASRRRYSFDFCSFEPTEAAALAATNRAKKGHCPKHVAAVTAKAFLVQENLKKQKHRRKRKGLQSRDDLQFLADLEELIGKFQVFRISHHSYNFYHENAYPSIFRVNFDHYYPMPYYPFDPLHYVRRNSEIKSKKRRGRPAKANEPMSKMPFIQGFSYPYPSGSYYAPYAMPYTSMPIATNMMNLGYYSQYPTPLYLPHTLGAATSPFMRPAVPPPQFHSSAHVKLSTAAKHKMKLGSQQMPSPGIEDSQSLLVSPNSGTANLPNVRLHKRKHKHKHKHTEDQLSRSGREDLGGLFSGAKNPCLLSILSDRLGMSEKEPSLPKLKDKQRNQQSTDTLLRGSRNLFEVDTLSTLSLSDSQQWKRTRERGELVRDFHAACSRRHSETIRTGKDLPSELLGRLQSPREAQANLGNMRQSLKSFGVYREQNIVPFTNSRVEKVPQTFNSSSPTLEEHSHPLKKIFKRKEVEELQHEVRKMCAFSKILSTKKNLDHVNKILKAKRLQRQAKTGNNVVKRRRGRPRKQPVLLEEEPAGQMPVLERCVDLPGRKVGRPSLAPEPLEFSNQDSIMDTIESVVHMARAQPKTPPSRGDRRWCETAEEVRPNRLRKCRGNGQDEITVPTSKQSSSGFSTPSYSLVR